MSVSKEQVLATAALARLDLTMGSQGRLSPEEAAVSLDRLAGQMEAIVRYMDILNHADTSNVQPLYSPMTHVAPPREDTAEKRFTAEEILANAPRRQGTFFVVPPVL